MRSRENRKTPNPSAAKRAEGPRRLAAGWAIADAVPEKVTVVVTADPEGVTVAGLKLQLTPVCRPEHAKLTAELKPLLGVIVTVAVAEEEPVSDPLKGLIDTEKSGVGALIVTETGLDVDAAKPVAPAYCATIECDPTARLEVVNVATPEAFSVPDPIVAPPSVKVTVPDGTVEPDATAT